jgi:acyl CoA:acetate/3-ketoacid CoA transferase alpha subunit
MKAVSAEEAVALIPNSASVMVGGFMGVGSPERLLDELVRQGKSELTIICNDAAIPGKGVGVGNEMNAATRPRIGSPVKTKQFFFDRLVP